MAAAGPRRSAPNITALGDGSARYHGHNGRILTFAADGCGSYRRPRDLDAGLVPLTAAGWSLRLRTGEGWLFDTAGGLCERAREGHRVVPSRDADGRVATVAHSVGWSLTFSYDGAGWSVTVCAGDGRATYYGYAAAGLPASVTAIDGALTRYGYDAGSRLSPGHRHLRCAARRRYLRRQGRVRRQVLTGGGSVEPAYDPATGTTSATGSPPGRTWTHRHDKGTENP
ncbi:MAG TPA: hypothetical protein VFC00_23235 [Micromonosporaceae bacterium]|nr:hypothetical protein [Micromonosporaceae bacterium]